MEANQKSNLKIEDYIPQWSANKYQEMKSQLNGYWEQDIWYPADNPVQDRSKIGKGIGSCVRLNKCPNKIKLEIKFACYLKIANKEWSAGTLHSNASKINRICEWLGAKHLNVETLLEKSLEQWLISLRTYLIETGKDYGQQVTQSIDTKGKPKAYYAQDDCIYKFTSIYKSIIDFYDDRNEYDKDIWDMRKLGLTNKYVSSCSQHILNFTELKNTWALSAAKKYIKYKLLLVAPNTCYTKLLSIKTFFNFIFSQNKNITSAEIDRNLILDYFGYLASLKHSDTHRHDLIANLRDFLELCENWLDITGNKIIYNDDLPKYKRNYKPKYIPETVITQINKNLEYIKNPMYQRMYLVLIECGMRVSELCHLQFSCLKQDKKGDFFLTYYQFKLKKYITVPISIITAKVIQEQQKIVRDKLGDNCNFLFPSFRCKTKIKAIGYKALVNAIRKLIYEKDIRDINGNLWHFTSHQCRHTVGTRMINNDVPQHIVQRFLGHESPTMTQVYAHVHDKTLKKEIAKYHDTRVVNVAGEVVESKSPELDNDLDLHLLKKKVLAQSLPNGSCGRPIVLGECPHSNACLTCGDFRTTIEFLEQHRTQLKETKKIIKNAEEKGWKRHAEMNKKVASNLEKIINTLESGDKDIVSGAEE